MTHTRRLLLQLLTILIALIAVDAAHAAKKTRIVTTIPSLAAIAREVAGEHAKVESLAGPFQDPHFVDGRPSHVIKLNRADLLIHVGLQLEIGWLPPLVTNARNGRIQPGRRGNLDASTVAGPLLERYTNAASRQLGDVHPGGNPHYLYDPRYGVRLAQAIAERLTELDPANASHYRANADEFAADMAKRIAGWEGRMRPHAGKPIVGYHKSLCYLARWLDIERAGYVEPFPGISPSPKHLAQLILHMRKNHIRVVVMEPWYNAETARAVAERAHATLVRLPGDVGTKEISTYADLIDRRVTLLDRAFSAEGAK